MNLKNCAVGIALSVSCYAPLVAQQKVIEPNTRVFLNNDYYIDGYVNSDEMANWESKEFITLKSKSGEFTIKTKEIKRIGQPEYIQIGGKIDRIRLKNDSVLEGVKISEDDNSIRLKINGGEMLINKSDIYRTEVVQIKRRPEPEKKKPEMIELIPHTEKEAKKEDEKSPWPDDSWPMEKKILKLIELLENKDDAIIYGGMEGNVYGKMKNKGAIQFLTEIGAPAVPFLTDKMDGSKPDVLSRICTILNQIKSPDTYKYMKNRLSDNYATVRSQAVTIISIAGNVDGSEFIRPLLKDKDTNVRFAVIDALSNLKDTDSLPDIASLLADADESIRRKVIITLPILYELEKDEYRKEKVIKALKDVADSKGEDSKKETAILLGKLKGNLATSKLTELLGDDSKSVRAVAAIALGDIGSSEATTVLTEKLKYEDESSVKVSILDALRVANAQDAIPTIVSVMQIGDTPTRQGCFRTLKALTGKPFGDDPGAWAKWWDEMQNGRQAK